MQRLQIGTPIAPNTGTIQIKSLIHQGMSQLNMAEIGEHKYAYLLFRDLADARTHPVDTAGMHPHRFSVVVLHKPARRVAEPMGRHDL